MDIINILVQPIEVLTATMSTQTAILLSGGAATIGWVYTAKQARLLARKQHTLNVILQTNMNEDFIKKRILVSNYIKNELRRNNDSDTSKSTAKNNKTGEKYDITDIPEVDRASIRAFLGHYEFLSAGLRNGYFDEKLMKDSERATYVNLFSSFNGYIYDLRGSRKRQALYEHLEWVYDRWEENPPGFVQRTIEWFLSRPIYGKSARDKHK